MQNGTREPNVGQCANVLVRTGGSGGSGRSRRTAGSGLRRMSAGGPAARISLMLILAGLLAGCATGGERFGLGLVDLSTIMSLPTAQFGNAPAYSLSAPIVQTGLVSYATNRLTDAADIFEVGVGLGWGLGAEASAGLGSVGLERGAYTWLGIFGADQIGVVQDDNFQNIGLPFSLIGSGASLASGTSVGGDALNAPTLDALAMALGYEDGIGGPGKSTGGYETLGPMGFAPGHDTWLSSSLPVGGSVALGPVAVVSRVRLAAVANFATGFLGFHVFSGPEEH